MEEEGGTTPRHLALNVAPIGGFAVWFFGFWSRFWFWLELGFLFPFLFLFWRNEEILVAAVKIANSLPSKSAELNKLLAIVFECVYRRRYTRTKD